jgi:hypothetical protein
MELSFSKKEKNARWTGGNAICLVFSLKSKQAVDILEM